jgi:hypothetical protein
VQRRLYEEVMAVIGDKTPTPELVKELKYMHVRLPRRGC